MVILVFGLKVHHRFLKIPSQLPLEGCNFGGKVDELPSHPLAWRGESLELGDTLTAVEVTMTWLGQKKSSHLWVGSIVS